MNWTEFKALFDQLISRKFTAPIYNEKQLDIISLNKSRMRRWEKLNHLDPKLKDTLEKLSAKQHWILITEPWCADSAHIAPIIQKIAEYSEYIELEVQLRDSPPFLIDSYLTKGAKSIPILIARDEQENDLFVWGPRPLSCTELVEKLKFLDLEAEEKKVLIQKWYNQDRGISLQNELNDELSNLWHKAELAS